MITHEQFLAALEVIRQYGEQHINFVQAINQDSLDKSDKKASVELLVTSPDIHFRVKEALFSHRIGLDPATATWNDLRTISQKRLLSCNGIGMKALAVLVEAAAKRGVFLIS